MLETGRRLGIRRVAREAGRPPAGVGALDGAIFGLMGLVVAFTFSGAATRFDVRRQLIVQETNDIGTAYLRLDLLPASTQAPLRESFRRYVDTRLKVYRLLPDVAAAEHELAVSATVQREIWTQAVAACRTAESPATTTLLLSALNAMIDITTTRTMAAQMHPPPSIFAMLFGLALASALLAGYAMADNAARSWLHMLGFATVMAVVVFVILQIEYPRLGLMRLDSFDQALAQLRQSMDAPVLSEPPR
ncbi:MAG: DUF4239 domain-containing protein [Candidatus Binatia bacterium]